LNAFINNLIFFLVPKVLRIIPRSKTQNLTKKIFLGDMIVKLIFFGNYLKDYLKLLENVKTANDPQCVQASIYQLLLGQKSKVRTLLKS